LSAALDVRSVPARSGAVCRQRPRAGVGLCCGRRAGRRAAAARHRDRGRPAACGAAHRRDQRRPARKRSRAADAGRVPVGDHAHEGRGVRRSARRGAAAGRSAAPVAVRDRADGDRARRRRMAGGENGVRNEGTKDMSPYHDIQQLLERVRRRWRTEVALRAATRAALAALTAVGVALVAARWIDASPRVLAAIAGLSLAAAVAAVVVLLLPLRRRPTDAQVARFIEERSTGLDDRLATAVDVARQPAPPPMADLMIADAARRAGAIDPASIVASESLRRVAFQAAAASLALLLVLVAGRAPLR